MLLAGEVVGFSALKLVSLLRTQLFDMLEVVLKMEEGVLDFLVKLFHPPDIGGLRSGVLRFG